MIRIICKKKSILFSRLVTIIVLTNFISCQQPPSPVAQTASYVHVPPVIDGMMDTIWHSVPVVNLKNYNVGAENVKDSNDLSSNYRMVWDTSRIYLLVKVKDDVKFYFSKIKYAIDVPPGYESDCIELLFDAKNRKINKIGTFDINDGDSRYEFVYDRKGITGTFKSTEEIVFAQSDIPDGYVFEISIPFRILSIPVKPGYTFGFELTVYDNDYGPDFQFYNYNENRSAISWSQKQGAEAWRNTGLFGNITLLKK